MTTLPTWAVYCVSFGTPAAAFVGVLVAQYITRKGARELETRSRREETMRTLRWAAELSVSSDDRIADLGVAQLETLLESDLLDETEKGFVEGALDTVYEDPEAELDGLGEDAEAVRYVEDVEVIPDDVVGVERSGSGENVSGARLGSASAPGAEVSSHQDGATDDGTDEVGRETR